MSSQKFIISKEEYDIELEYSDLKTKKLSSACEIKYNKSLIRAAIIVWIIASVIFIYDFFKDLGRSVSSVKDLFNGKTNDGLAKFVGFTKGNIVRALTKFGLVILGFVLFYLSSYFTERNCINNGDPFLIVTESIIKYNDAGIPIDIET